MMKSINVCLLFALLLLITCAQAQLCKNNNDSCDEDNSCCSGCCIENRCVPWNNVCLRGRWCDNCGSQEKCELQQVQCFRAPCPPIPTCVPNCRPPCQEGRRCILEDLHCAKPCGKRAICVPIE